MDHTIQQLISFIDDHDDIPTEDAITLFFSETIWSLEQDEWQRMTLYEKEAFIKKVNQTRGKNNGNTSSGRRAKVKNVNRKGDLQGE